MIRLHGYWEISLSSSDSASMHTIRAYSMNNGTMESSLICFSPCLSRRRRFRSVRCMHAWTTDRVTGKHEVIRDLSRRRHPMDVRAERDAQGGYGLVRSKSVIEKMVEYQKPSRACERNKRPGIEMRGGAYVWRKSIVIDSS